MIKLIVSDVDGTLLGPGEILSGQLVSTIKRVKEQGILFAVASGRPYMDLRRLFREVEEDIAFIASDGALVRYKNELVGKFPMDRDLGFSLMQKVYTETEAETVLYGAYMAYMIPKEEAFKQAFRSSVHNHTVEVACMKKVEEEYLKIGVYHKEDVEKYAGPVLSCWKDKLHLVYHSKNWMEFTGTGVHKGIGLKKLMEVFGIASGEVMAFGDNLNDLEMLDMAGFAYAMAEARKEVKECCGYETKNVAETIENLVLK